MLCDDTRVSWDSYIYSGGCYFPIGYTGPACTDGAASGKWQFLRSTWAKFMGYINAADAPEDVQDAKARITWAWR